MGHRGIEVEVGGKKVAIELAPGLKLAPAELNQVRHHAVLADGLAVEASMRGQDRDEVRAGRQHQHGRSGDRQPRVRQIEAADGPTQTGYSGGTTVRTDRH
jgi:beta-glucosidase